MNTLLAFFAGLFVGGIAGILTAGFCAAARRGRHEAAEYRRYLSGVSDPRD